VTIVLLIAIAVIAAIFILYVIKFTYI